MSPLPALLVLAAPPKQEVATAPFRDLPSIERYYVWLVEYAKAGDGTGLSNLLADHSTSDYQLFPGNPKPIDLNTLQAQLVAAVQEGKLANSLRMRVVKVQGNGHPAWTLTIRQEWSEPTMTGPVKNYAQLRTETWVETKVGYRLKKTVLAPRKALPAPKA